ncbi:glycosyltransferase family 4 protein [Bradyrhizobium sp. STM 3809]|uniref:glycosyltransferase family 4 protein n=1 Tax=Bradyrhizobium sp. STM 3809 TaxID=551936 RepID=UPI00054DA4B3|nr:glycosyltransferase family 4 protein [Bradyrhizobium sp. STM 3809]
MKTLSILTPTRYPWRFNGPRHSRHRIEHRTFLPLNYVSTKIEGITLFNPLPPRRFDLVHAFNRLPIGTTPYIIGFESHLPRAYGLEQTAYFRTLRRSLASPRCRGIIAISEHARRIFEAVHADAPEADVLLAKTIVRFPNLPLPDLVEPDEPRISDHIRVSFVGNHFARKGGCVAIRLAELAAARGIALHLTIASTLTMGRGIWTDPQREGYFDDWLRRLEHPAITLLGPIDNAAVMDLFRYSDFSLLTTFSDTFGYSALEAMAVGCPVIGTRQGALPEFIRDGQNGILLDLPTDEYGEWIESNTANRDSPAFEAKFTDEVERLAQQALDAIVRTHEEPGVLARMRVAARQTIATHFGSQDASRFWDDYYEVALNS